MFWVKICLILRAAETKSPIANLFTGFAVVRQIGRYLPLQKRSDRVIMRTKD